MVLAANQDQEWHGIWRAVREAAVASLNAQALAHASTPGNIFCHHGIAQQGHKMAPSLPMRGTSLGIHGQVCDKTDQINRRRPLAADGSQR